MLTTRDVALMFGVTTTTVRRWCDCGRLPGAEKVGEGYRATWVIPEEALEGFEPPRPGRPQRPPRSA
ncbi:MAG: helix-turn-helix domain-containing protein [Chloroflexi bacterium]|nr:helix-turn-helix domain-containing protein [Chloroflexota bacterium]